MADIMEYLAWRGDVPFSAAPLCDVDSYMLSKVGTIDWTGIVPEDKSYIPLADAARSYFDNGGEARLGLLTSPKIAPMVKALGNTARFRDVSLTLFRRRVSEEETEQFSALTLRLPDGRHYISYRGTDDSIVGWRENCLLSVRDTVPAQRDALAYLEEAATLLPGSLLVGGHSKGGNLAVFAAASAPAGVQKRIETVWNFDGPGFRTEFLEREGYRNIREKLRTVLSQHAMVGTLLTQEENCIIVKSSAVGVAAHDGFTWQTEPRGFVRCDKLAPASRAFDRAMEAVLAGMDNTARESFIEAFFGTLSSSGAETLTDLTEQNIRRSLAMVHTLHREPEVQATLTSLLENMAKNYVSERRRKKH